MTYESKRLPMHKFVVSARGAKGNPDGLSKLVKSTLKGAGLLEADGDRSNEKPRVIEYKVEGSSVSFHYVGNNPAEVRDTIIEVIQDNEHYAARSAVTVKFVPLETPGQETAERRRRYSN